jgi:hypothetical protein
MTPAQVQDCTRNPAWQVPLAECCQLCLHDDIVKRKAECTPHGVAAVAPCRNEPICKEAGECRYGCFRDGVAPTGEKQ